MAVGLEHLTPDPEVIRSNLTRGVSLQRLSALRTFGAGTGWNPEAVIERTFSSDSFILH